MSMCVLQKEERFFHLFPFFFISVQGAKLPMSIIIVGVGQAEFDGTATLIPLPAA